MGLLVPLVFFVMIAGLVTLGLGLNILQKWATHRFANREADERFMAMEDRIAELEERVDFTERSLGEVTSHGRLASGDTPTA